MTFNGIFVRNLLHPRGDMCSTPLCTSGVPYGASLEKDEVGLLNWPLWLQIFLNSSHLVNSEAARGKNATYV
jgi:hypothetical protein